MVRICLLNTGPLTIGHEHRHQVRMLVITPWLLRPLSLGWMVICIPALLVESTLWFDCYD